MTDKKCVEITNVATNHPERERFRSWRVVIEREFDLLRTEKVLEVKVNDGIPIG